MTDGLTAFIFGVGVGAWAYNKLMKYTYNTKNSVTGGSFAGVAAFIVLFLFLKYVVNY